MPSSPSDKDVRLNRNELADAGSVVSLKVYGQSHPDKSLLQNRQNPVRRQAGARIWSNIVAPSVTDPKATPSRATFATGLGYLSAAVPARVIAATARRPVLPGPLPILFMKYVGAPARGRLDDDGHGHEIVDFRRELTRDFRREVTRLHVWFGSQALVKVGAFSFFVAGVWAELFLKRKLSFPVSRIWQ